MSLNTDKIELLAPGGDVDSIKAAVLAGANAVYCGLEKFNARSRASNITFENLNGIIRFAHRYDCEVFLTLNIIILEPELPALFKVLNRLVNTNIDGVIVQDLGLFYILSEYFPTLHVHVSTQATTHNEGQLKFLKVLNATRVNLSREMNLNEIQDLTAKAHESEILTEVFVHGATCIGFSGQCYISSVQGGNSGNRGRCSQPCRDEYVTTSQGKHFPLNIKDNSAFNDFKALAAAGVDSIKIEGRIKKFDYVYTVVDTWNQQLQRHYNQQELSKDDSTLRKVFNRGLSNSFLSGEIRSDMFTDNPRDNSLDNLKALQGKLSSEEYAHKKTEVFDEKEAILQDVQNRISKENVELGKMTLSFMGSADEPLKVLVKTSDSEFELVSQSKLAQKELGSQAQSLDKNLLLNRFKSLSDSEFELVDIATDDLGENLLLPFKDLTILKKEIWKAIQGCEFVAPVEFQDVKPVNQKYTQIIDSIESIESTRSAASSSSKSSKKLSILISDKKQLKILEGLDTDIDVYFKLPDCLGKKTNQYIDILNSHPRLIPWFTSILIGENYHSALRLLQSVNSSKIVTNNSGIAIEASKLGRDWIAGPLMNIVNSFSLKCLQEKFNCSGAFLSNELNKNQLKNIQVPANFEIHYSIYHPIDLLTSRQCLFHQVTGCHKHLMDNTCISHCDKKSSITNLKAGTLMIEKLMGNYHRLYNESNYLNLEVVQDLPKLVDNYCVDLHPAQTHTQVKLDTQDFINSVKGVVQDVEHKSASLKEHLLANIESTTLNQYYKGL